MRYLIAIPAALACIFYVYVLVQLRRDEKHYKSPANGGEAPAPQPRLVAFKSVRPLGRSFAEWSRLSQKRVKSWPKRQALHMQEPADAGGKPPAMGYVEAGLPLSSGVAPNVGNRGDKQVCLPPKKIA